MCSSFDYFHARACELAGMDAIGAAGSFINFFVRGRLSANDDTLEDALMALEGVRNGAPNTFIFMLPHSLMSSAVLSNRCEIRRRCMPLVPTPLEFRG